MDETKVMETLKVREGKRKRERKLEEDRVGGKKIRSGYRRGRDDIRKRMKMIKKRRNWRRRCTSRGER